MANQLAERIRIRMGDLPNSGEMRMFGGTCFTLNGNMCVVARRDDSLLARIGAEQQAAALAKPGVEPMVMRGREMKGYVIVSADRLEDAELKDWIKAASNFVGTLPAKDQKRKSG